MVGNSIGNPPASMTPRFTASMSWSALPWHGLKALPVLAIPITRPVERIIRVPGALDEGFAQEDGETEVAVVGQPLAQAVWLARSGLGALVLGHLRPLCDELNRVS